MSIISLICKQCGGQCEFDEKRETGFCNHCGTKIVIKSDVIENVYNTTHHTTQNITKNIYGGKNDKCASELVEDALKLFELGQGEKARKLLEQATDEEPENWKAWYHLGKMGAAYKAADDAGKDFVFDTLLRSEVFLDDCFFPFLYVKYGLSDYQVREQDKQKFINERAKRDNERTKRDLDLKKIRDEHDSKCKAVLKDKKYMKNFKIKHGMLLEIKKCPAGTDLIIPYGITSIHCYRNRVKIVNLNLLIPSTVEIVNSYAFKDDTFNEVITAKRISEGKDVLVKKSKKYTEL